MVQAIEAMKASMERGEFPDVWEKQVRSLIDERDEAEEYLPDATGPYQTLGERTKLLKYQMEYAAESGGQLHRALEAANEEIASLKRKVLDNITRHEDVEAQIRRDAGEQLRVLREALERIQEVAAAAPHPRDVTKHDCDLCKVHKISDAALASTAPVAAKCECHLREKQVCDICQNVAEAVKEEGEK